MRLCAFSSSSFERGRFFFRETEEEREQEVDVATSGKLEVLGKARGRSTMGWGRREDHFWRILFADYFAESNIFLLRLSSSLPFLGNQDKGGTERGESGIPGFPPQMHAWRLGPNICDAQS